MPHRNANGSAFDGGGRTRKSIAISCCVASNLSAGSLSDPAGAARAVAIAVTRRGIATNCVCPTFIHGIRSDIFTVFGLKALPPHLGEDRALHRSP
eukprot:2128821-Prymnesium_polylepis.1